MLRLAIFVNSLRTGGVERIAVTMSRHLADAPGLAVDLVACDAKGELAASVDPRVRIVNLRAHRLLASIRPLRSYLRDERPDVLISHGAHANFVAIGASRSVRRRPTLVLVEQSDPSSHDRSYGGVVRWMAPPLRALGYPLADHIVAVSASCRAALGPRIFLRRTPVSLIYNPVVDERLRELAAEPFIHPWLALGEPLILGVGRLAPEKNFAQLLRVFASFATRRRCRLLIVGDGPERTALESLAASLGISDRVHFTGMLANPLPVMRAAGALVLTSRFEGLPTVLIEAIAVGCPIVAVDCPSGPREILDGGRFGELVAPRDDAALVEAIERTLDRPRSGERAAQRADAFSAATSIDAYLELVSRTDPRFERIRRALLPSADVPSVRVQPLAEA